MQGEIIVLVELLDSWFFLSFPRLVTFVKPRVRKETKNLAGRVLRLIQIRLTTASLAKNTLACQVNSPQSTGRRFQFQKRSQLFIATHNEAPSAVAMRVSKRSRPWPTTSNADS